MFLLRMPLSDHNCYCGRYNGIQYRIKLFIAFGRGATMCPAHAYALQVFISIMQKYDLCNCYMFM